MKYILLKNIILWNKKNTKVGVETSKGFSLIEILIAIGVFLVFVTATMNILVGTNRQLENSNNKERAVALANEGLEAIRNIRDNNFSNLIDGTYGLSSSLLKWDLSGISDTNGIFVRSLNISSINSNQKKIIVTVIWSDQISQNNSVVESTYLTNWRAPLNIGLNIDKVVIGGAKVASDFLPYNLNTNVWDNTVDPPVLQNINIPIIFAPSTMSGLSPGVYTFLTSSDPDYNLSLSSACIDNSITLTNGATACTITYTAKSIDCTGTPWGIMIDGSSNTAYLASSVSYPGACQSEMRTCTAGVLSGSYTYTSCMVIPTAPTVTTTTPVTSITQTTAVGGGNVTSNGGVTVTVSGLVWSTSVNPTIADSKTTDGWALDGPWTSNITGLTPNTLYHIRAYATNSVGTSYGADITFSTLSGACAITGIVPTNYDNSGSTSATIAKPTGVIQNDIMFAYILHNNSTDRLTTIPSGWIQIGRHKNGNSNQALYYKIAGASEPSNYVFGLSSSSRFAITINAYRGCFNTTNPIDVISNTEYVVNNTTYRAASMTLPSAYTTVIMFPSVNTSGSRTFSAPLTQGGGWIQDYANGNSSSQFSRNAYSKLITATGLTGVINSIGFSASTGKHAFAVALKPL